MKRPKAVFVLVAVLIGLVSGLAHADMKLATFVIGGMVCQA
jgi:hypothetical protein